LQVVAHQQQQLDELYPDFVIDDFEKVNSLCGVE